MAAVDPQLAAERAVSLPELLTSRECRQARQLFIVEKTHAQVLVAGHLALHSLPPYVRGALAVSVQHHARRLVAGLANALLVGQSHLDPHFQPIVVVALPDLRLVVGAQPFGEHQPFVGMADPGQQAQHHALLVFGRVLRQRQRGVVVEVTIHISNIDRGFINGCFQRHG